jgi:hypothetical protein
MKNSKYLIVIIPFLLLSLSSCTEQATTSSDAKKDPYEFKESEPLSDKELGLSDINYGLKNFEDDIYDVPTTLNPTADNEYLTYDPLSKVDQVSLDAGWANLNEDDSSLDQDTYPALWRKHFKGSTYKTYSNSTLQNDSPYYYLPFYKRKVEFVETSVFDENNADLSLVIDCYNAPTGPHYSPAEKFCISAVESNGVFSYIFDSDYYYHLDRPFGDEFGILNFVKYAYKIFLGLRHNAYFPYRIYFDYRYIYAMSYDEKFSKEYIKSFNEEEDLHLFKL